MAGTIRTPPPAIASQPAEASFDAVRGGWLAPEPGGGFDADSGKRSSAIILGIFLVYMAVATALYLWRDIEFTTRVWALLILVGAVLLGQWTAPLLAKVSQGKVIALLFLAFMGIGLGLILWRGTWITPDRWALFLLIGAIIAGQGLAFVRDWVPVVLLIFGYEFMRGIAGEMVREQGRTVHLGELIQADRVMFGGELPTLWIQDKLYTVGTVHWYDYLAVAMYALHFVFPLVFAFILWLGRKERFWQFSLAFLLMTYAAFAFFLFYPAAPPWLAQEWNRIHGVQWPATQTWQALAPERFDDFDTYQIWNKASGNAVAAFPSLHAGFPWLTLLFAVKFFGWRGLVFIVYNVALWFSVVYLGHHWVIDIVGGMAWATICFVIVVYAWPWLMRGVINPIPGLVRRLKPSRSPRPADVG